MSLLQACVSVGLLCTAVVLGQTECVRSDMFQQIGDEPAIGPALVVGFNNPNLGECALQQTNATNTSVPSSCVHTEMCVPEISELQEFHTLMTSGFREIVIKSCTKKCIGACQRVCSKTVVFPGSLFERTIDVGRCVGQCEERIPPSPVIYDCDVARSHTVCVEGPNGNRTVRVIDECRCGHRHCHRELQMLYYTDYSAGEDGVVTSKEKVVDVGKCMGACPLRCEAKSFSSLQYTNKDLQQVNVTIIEDCGCQIPGVY